MTLNNLNKQPYQYPYHAQMKQQSILMHSKKNPVSLPATNNHRQFDVRGKQSL